VHVESAPDAAAARREAAAAQLSQLIKNLVGVTAGVAVKEPGAIERSLGKAKRVVDKRPKG
jgi:phenylacetate-CoA ligase